MSERKKSIGAQQRSAVVPNRNLAESSGTPAPISRIKILSVGSVASGKSCLIKRYCEERFVSKYIATIGVDYGVKPVQVTRANGTLLSLL